MVQAAGRCRAYRVAVVGVVVEHQTVIEPTGRALGHVSQFGVDADGAAGRVFVARTDDAAIACCDDARHAASDGDVAAGRRLGRPTIYAADARSVCAARGRDNAAHNGDVATGATISTADART